MYFYSASSSFFYHLGLHSRDQMPADAVEVSDEDHAAMMAGLEKGLVIEPDQDGRPSLTERPAPAPHTVDEIHELRRYAYRNESDPLKNEAEYDAMVAGTDPDFSAWMAKVAEIKERYPLPDQ